MLTSECDSGWVACEMRNLPRFSPMRLALVLTGGFFVVVVVVAVLATRSGGNDAQTASNVTTPAEKRPVKVVITGTERRPGGADRWRDRRLGHIQGQRRDHGPGDRHHLSGTDRSGRLGDLASLRDEGQEGRDHLHGEDRHDPEAGETAVVDRVCDRRVQGATGQGHESENATYTVSTLRGKVWR